MTHEPLPDFIGDRPDQSITQSVDPIDAARALLDQLQYAAFSMALTDAVDLWAQHNDNRDEVMEYALPLYDALTALAVACGWEPPSRSDLDQTTP